MLQKYYETALPVMWMLQRGKLPGLYTPLRKTNASRKALREAESTTLQTGSLMGTRGAEVGSLLPGVVDVI